MMTLNGTQAAKLASCAALFDRIATVIYGEITKEGILNDPSEHGVVITPIEGELSFYATVHRVKLLVRYEHMIETLECGRLLKGVFRAYLLDPLKAEKIQVSSFSFDAEKNFYSTENFIKPFIRDKDTNNFSIRQDVALLLAYDVQQYIQAPPVKA
jgi:hypothetical protein